MKNNLNNGRRDFIKQTAIGVASGFSLQGGGFFNETEKLVSKKEAFGFAAQPVLANIGENQIEIIVAPNDYATAWVEYGEGKSLNLHANGSTHGLMPTSNRVMRFTISDLEPGKLYSYRVQLRRIVYHNKWKHDQIDEAASETQTFRTLDPNAATASFTCWNDTHENADTVVKLNALLKKQSSDFLLWNGDVTNDIHQEEQIVGQFLNPAGQAFATSTPLMINRGNHDVRGRDARYVRNYLSGPEEQDYYGFRQGPLACIVMDTGEDKPDNHSDYAGLTGFSQLRTRQADWLADLIEQPWFTSAPFKVAFLHIPLVWEAEVPERWPGVWGAGIQGWKCEDGYNKWHDLLVKSGIKLVISGHTHHHAYFPPNKERPYGQLIGGGPQPDQATCITGHADKKTLTINMTDLEGNNLKKLQFT
ncbi:MAG: FN3 domain-containing metallophosphoesterase family protein [Balneolales bacterium]